MRLITFATDNGVFGILWLGSGVSPKVLLDLYGSENFGELESRMVSHFAPSARLAVS